MKKKRLTIINISLGLVAIVLFSHLMGLKLPTMGHASYLFDTKDPICITGFEDHKSIIDNKEACCFEIQKQLTCEIWNEKIILDSKELSINKRCHTGEGTVEYFINNKMYNYCKKEGYLGYVLF